MKVFLSMSFKGKTDEKIAAQEKVAKEILEANCICSEPIEIICNYWYIAPGNGEKKLNELSNAFKLMAECDYIAIMYNKEGKLARGSEIERMAWESCKPGNTIFYLYEKMED